MMCWIGGMKMNEVKRKLFDKLKAFHNNKDFVIGVMSNVSHDDDRQAIINYIDKGDNVTIDNLILLSLHLNKERKRYKASCI